MRGQGAQSSSGAAAGTSTSGTTGSGSAASIKRQKTGEPVSTSSAFQELFAQRTQGFQIEFRFRNAPPRPPVGPCFVGHSIDSLLAEQSRYYKPLNAVEVNHTWKLHNEPDIGVPLAPSAMDVSSYNRPDENAEITIHPDDDAILNWTGNMGDTSAEDCKRRQEQARVAARLALSGRSPATASNNVPRLAGQVEKVKKKVFSRMLKEDMQTWMKKTTYLSNDYSRKVHDFKSLAQTKSELATDLQSKQTVMASQRSSKAISDSFRTDLRLEHPVNKQLKPVRVLQVLPDFLNWGRAFTHVVIDKAPTTLPPNYTVGALAQAFVTNVEKQRSTARMTCNVIVPGKDIPGSDTVSGNHDFYRPVQSYDIDVFPLKEEDTPHMNFCLSDDGDVATYLPVASRVQLSVGRPSKSVTAHSLERRPFSDNELADVEERMAEVDQDMADKHHIHHERTSLSILSTVATVIEKNDDNTGKDEDDGEDDFGDDDSDEEEVFGDGTKTIVAES